MANAHFPTWNYLHSWQHLGAATGLIDFTYDPLIALWFAIMDGDHDGKVIIVEISNTDMFRNVTYDHW